MIVRFETQLWNALPAADRVTLSGVIYDPAPEMTVGRSGEDGTAPVPTGYVLVNHLDINDLDALLLKIQKIRLADQLRI